MRAKHSIETKFPEWALDLRIDQMKWVLEYVVDCDETAATIRSGLCPDKSKARQMGKTYRRHEAVQQALAIFYDDERESRKALRNRMIEELTALSFYEVGDYIAIRKNTVQITDTDELDVRQMKAFKRVKQVRGKSPSMEVEFHDKIKAMELLDRMTGGQLGNQMNVNINGGKGGGIAVQITPLEAMAAGIGTQKIKNGKLIDEQGNPIDIDKMGLS